MNKAILENNIMVFNNDVKESDGYIYANQEIYSAKLATSRQTEGIVKIIKSFKDRNIKIIDIGCGDGTFTIELFNKASPLFILGFDPANYAIKRAHQRIKNRYHQKIVFTECSIYQINKFILSHSFDIAIIRGVLHHLDNPERAIAEISRYFPKIIVLEPNGLNPILKIVEKVSKYHVNHQERSYRPSTIRRWFNKSNYSLSENHFIVLVPYFCNPALGRLLKLLEPFVEAIPLIRNIFCGSVVSYYEKK